MSKSRVEELDFSVFERNAIRLLQDVGASTFEQFRTVLLATLRKEPRRRKYPSDYPIEWTSERQRRAYFATNGFGAGIPYRRTGKLLSAWYAATQNVARGIRVDVGNKSSYARYVYGGLERDTQVALKNKQRFHTVTGWKLLNTTVDDELNRFSKSTLDAWQLALRRER